VTNAAGGLRTYHDAVALVTGAASGIGAALARELCARGAHVVLADRDGERLCAEAARLPRDRSAWRTLDVRDATAVDAAVADAFRAHGRLDYLFNNAGIAVGGEATAYSVDDWHQAVAVNFLGPVHGVAAAYPRMVRQGFGHVVNTASMAAFVATPLAAPYGATKAGVVALSRALRLEGRAHGVRVSALCPGVIRTPILDNGGRHGILRSFLPAEEQHVLWQRLRPMDPGVLARKALDAVARNRGVIVIPAWWRLIRFLNGVSPRLADAITMPQLRGIRDRIARTSRP
jgi:NAD(P)-dependent dehydrogenase (short-subunit alcohol dehydrogenase family)